MSDSDRIEEIRPPRFYCWDCDNTSARWPTDRGEVACKWCGSRDVTQILACGSPEGSEG